MCLFIECALSCLDGICSPMLRSLSLSLHFCLLSVAISLVFRGHINQANCLTRDQQNFTIIFFCLPICFPLFRALLLSLYLCGRSIYYATSVALHPSMQYVCSVCVCVRCLFVCHCLLSVGRRGRLKIFQAICGIRRIECFSRLKCAAK